MRPVPLSLLVLLLCSPFAVPQSIWSLTAEQRQAILAEQAQNAELNREREIQMQSRIRADQQEQAIEAQRAAQLQLQATQQNIANAYATANSATATLEASAEQQMVRSEQANLADRVRAAKEALREWHPGHGYIAARAPIPRMLDPFASAVAPNTAKPERPLSALLQGSCLCVDNEHDVARASITCSWPEVSGTEVASLYPVLADGSLLDNAEHVQQFLTLAKDPKSKLWFLYGEGTLRCFR